jgi:hypothetical protein
MTTPTAPRPRWKLWALAAGLIALPVVALGLYTLAALGWSYSDGERAGVLQKFSHKGWVCKTYEGELALYVVPGVAPTIWEFTVRDPAVADRLNAALGKHVSLHYEEHRGLPTSCLGQTAYFVDDVKIVR